MYSNLLEIKEILKKNKEPIEEFIQIINNNEIILTRSFKETNSKLRIKMALPLEI